MTFIITIQSWAASLYHSDVPFLSVASSLPFSLSHNPFFISLVWCNTELSMSSYYMRYQRSERLLFLALLFFFSFVLWKLQQQEFDIKSIVEMALPRSKSFTPLSSRVLRSSPPGSLFNLVSLDPCLYLSPLKACFWFADLEEMPYVLFLYCCSAPKIQWHYKKATI